jgi:zinc-ribbon domain
MMADYRCPSCSNPIAPDARFCPSCGQRLTMAPAPGPAVGPAAVPSVPPPPAQRSGPPAILIVVALVVVGGLAAFGLVQTGVIGARPTVPPPGATIAPPTSAPGVSDDCIRELGPFVSALEDLDSRLSVGLNFNDYSTRVGDTRVAYDRINLAKVDTLCLTVVGSPAEDALNAYVEAYNTWNDCIGTPGCTNDSIKSQLQAQWSKATSLIDRIRASID